ELVDPSTLNPQPSTISASHCEDFTLVVTGEGSVACDLESVAHRSPEQWQDLLGPERFKLAKTVAADTAEELDAVATRVWTAIECLKKAGSPPDAPLVLGRVEKDKWIIFNSGS